MTSSLVDGVILSAAVLQAGANDVLLRQCVQWEIPRPTGKNAGSAG